MLNQSIHVSKCTSAILSSSWLGHGESIIFFLITSFRFGFVLVNSSLLSSGSILVLNNLKAFVCFTFCWWGFISVSTSLLLSLISVKVSTIFSNFRLITCSFLTFFTFLFLIFIIFSRTIGMLSFVRYLETIVGNDTSVFGFLITITCFLQV